MAKLVVSGVGEKITIKKKTSSSGNPRMVKASSMNKHKRRRTKRYRGQGR